MNWVQAAALTAGAAALVWILSSVGFAVVARDILLGGIALPAAIGIHMLQLGLSGYAWRAALGATRLGVLRVGRIRWIREGVNTLLPAAQIGGQVVGVRLLIQAGVVPVRAVAGTILDLVLEAGSQLLVTLAAVALLLRLQEGPRDWLVWAEAGLVMVALTVAALVVALRLGLLRLVEAAVQRAVARWPSPTIGQSMDGLHAMLMRRAADRPALLRAFFSHSLSWSLGALEVWIMLRALGHRVGLGPAFIIESLAMLARSSAFAIPGAVGVQEGGFVLACGLFGIGADAALALSVLKRLRELAISLVALLIWQFPGKRLPQAS